MVMIFFTSEWSGSGLGIENKSCCPDEIYVERTSMRKSLWIMSFLIEAVLQEKMHWANVIKDQEK